MAIEPRPLPSLLIVDDEPEITELLGSVMEGKYTIDSASDVPGALARLDHDPPPDLILLDCLLPGGRCTRVLEKLGSNGCAVVQISGLPQVLEELAGYGYPSLAKPFRLGQLFDAIPMAVAQRRK